MLCPDCRIECRRFGKHRNGLQRFRCAQCGKTYTEEHEKPLGDMTVPMEKAVLALKLLVEGASIRSVERITELHRDTICRLLVLAGEKCEKIMAKQVRNLRVQDVECDEVWGYVGKKEGHKKADEADVDGLGDVFIEGLRDALEPHHRFQITTDGFRPYVSAISTTLGHRVDFAQLIKVYRAPSEGEGRYSPATVESVEVVPVIGNPDPDRICTSIVERQNLTIRMQVRRMTRLTNGFSKKFENHWAALCLHFVYYNFCRVHKSLRVTPAMASGLTDHIWSIEETLTET